MSVSSREAGGSFIAALEVLFSESEAEFERLNQEYLGNSYNRFNFAMRTQVAAAEATRDVAAGRLDVARRVRDFYSPSCEASDRGLEAIDRIVAKLEEGYRAAVSKYHQVSQDKFKYPGEYHSLDAALLRKDLAYTRLEAAKEVRLAYLSVSRSGEVSGV